MAPVSAALVRGLRSDNLTNFAQGVNTYGTRVRCVCSLIDVLVILQSRHNEPKPLSDHYPPPIEHASLFPLEYHCKSAPTVLLASGHATRPAPTKRRPQPIFPAPPALHLAHLSEDPPSSPLRGARRQTAKAVVSEQLTQGRKRYSEEEEQVLRRGGGAGA